MEPRLELQIKRLMWLTIPASRKTGFGEAGRDARLRKYARKQDTSHVKRPREAYAYQNHATIHLPAWST